MLILYFTYTLSYLSKRKIDQPFLLVLQSAENINFFKHFSIDNNTKLNPKPLFTKYSVR